MPTSVNNRDARRRASMTMIETANARAKEEASVPRPRRRSSITFDDGKNKVVETPRYNEEEAQDLFWQDEDYDRMRYENRYEKHLEARKNQETRLAVQAAARSRGTNHEFVLPVPLPLNSLQRRSPMELANIPRPAMANGNTPRIRGAMMRRQRDMKRSNTYAECKGDQKQFAIAA
mmetsp:Transcript_14035/g.21906  ORF Transcript_14035/g.21906 Transcript_14035/m.21906 type:complete len:176 (-) Transcript_14035:68-595(-)|eukprot:CAMPEP_0195282832 /NCGR_PEP_ID=MMETSP0707-20130614/1578_1 /TAXON_ID=33640 /ORGANISM="Asterionellopsis glacialis, Strain CCMP134" /LENGTH=175 /DNA_ID=CAMNT_0040341887 /DNA_START=81 /DNA_END=608 /DNA_ORIENTATION=+